MKLSPFSSRKFLPCPSPPVLTSLLLPLLFVILLPNRQSLYYLWCFILTIMNKQRRKKLRLGRFTNYGIWYPWTNIWRLLNTNLWLKLPVYSFHLLECSPFHILRTHFVFEMETKRHKMERNPSLRMNH